MIVKTNIFNRRLSIATFSHLNFVITMIINTLKILLTRHIRTINIDNLSKTFNNHYCDLSQLSYHLVDSLYFLRKTSSIREIRVSNQVLRTRNWKQAKKDSSKIIMTKIDSTIVRRSLIDRYKYTSSRNTRRIKTTKLRKSFTNRMMTKISTIIMSRKIFNTMNYTTSSQTTIRHLTSSSH